MEPCQIATNGKLQRLKYLQRIFMEIDNNENIKVDLLIGANCLEALNHLMLYQAKIKVHMHLEQLWDGALNQWKLNSLMRFHAIGLVL